MVSRPSALLVLLAAAAVPPPAAAQPPVANPSSALAFYGFDSKLPMPDYCVLGGCSNMTNLQGQASTWSAGNPNPAAGFSFSTASWTLGPGTIGLTGPGGTLAVSGNGNVWCFPTYNYTNVQCRFDSTGSATGPGQMNFVGFSAAATSATLGTDYASLISTLTVASTYVTSPTLLLPASASNQPKVCCAVFAAAGTTAVGSTSTFAVGGTYRLDNVWAWGSVAGALVTCPVGSFLNSTAGTCVPCPAGTTTAASGATSVASCSVCVAGYAGSAGSCAMCNANFYSAAGASTCSACPQGATSAPGASSCTCPAMYFGTGTGAALTCTACPMNSTSTTVNNAGTCVCARNFYSTGFGASLVCSSCPGGYDAAPGSLSCGRPFSVGNIIVHRVGNGSAALSVNATETFIDELAPSTGAVVQSVQTSLRISGTDRYVGALARNADGQIVTFAGVTAPAGTPPGPSAPFFGAAAGRVVASLYADGSIDCSTVVPTSVYDGIIRGACASTDWGFWLVGNATTAQAKGVAYVPYGDVTGTGVVNIYSGASNFVSCAVQGSSNVTFLTQSTGYVSVSTMPVGFTAATGAAWTSLTPTNLGTASLWSKQTVFTTIVPGTLYLADSDYNGVATNAAIWKSTAPFTSYSTYLQGVVVMGLALSPDETLLYYATMTQVFRINAGAAAGAPVLLAMAAANTNFRGLALAPCQIFSPPTADGNFCSQCAQGLYATSPVTCVACPPGTGTPYPGATSASQCTVCGPGRFGTIADGCTTCAAGTYSGFGAASCSSCSALSAVATSAPGSASCSCPANYYSTGSGSTLACVACASGSVSAAGTAGACYCPANTFSTGSGANITCTPCPQYSNSTANTPNTCACPATFTTSGTGAAMICTPPSPSPSPTLSVYHRPKPAHPTSTHSP